MKKLTFLLHLLVFLLASEALAQTPQPNILWLSAEDIGPHLGCYEDTVARTPNIDALAAKGLTYDLAWSNYPVCAPARTTIITGLYASSMGAGNMRSNVPLDADLKLFPEYLRSAGYHCSNHSKTDYNVITSSPWDVSSKKADYRDRTPKSKPFFAVINQGVTHESKIRKRPHELKTDPQSIQLPPYYPDLPEVRHDWAQYYDNIETMDEWVGKQLERLEKTGQADNTIVVFFGDHGSGMPRHKRYAGDSGMRVPLIIYVPEKLAQLAPKDYQPGGRSNRPVGFVDFAPTMLSLIGVEPPEVMQGHAIMGQFETQPPEFVYGFRSRMDESIDCSRAISDGRYVYIRNFMPHLPHGQFVDYQRLTPTTASWNRLFDEGKLNDVQSKFWKPKHFEELYDLQQDPHETINLALVAEDATNKDAAALARFREAYQTSMDQFGDAGLIPEPLTAATSAEESAFDEKLTPKFSGVAEAALKATHPRTSIEEVFEMLAAIDRPATRHWGSIGLLTRAKAALEHDAATLRKLVRDDELSTVRVNIAEVLAQHGQPADLELGLQTLVEIADLNRSDYYSAVWALNAIERLGERANPIRDALTKLPRKPTNQKRGNSYVEDLIARITKK